MKPRTYFLLILASITLLSALALYLIIGNDPMRRQAIADGLIHGARCVPLWVYLSTVCASVIACFMFQPIVSRLLDRWMFAGKRWTLRLNDRLQRENASLKEALAMETVARQTAEDKLQTRTMKITG